MSDSKIKSEHFTSSGSWTCPAGVTRVFLLGQGGGQGGGGAATSTSSNSAGAGGVGTSPYMVQFPVVPNTTYTVTIGTGGAGALGTVGSFRTIADDGGNTTFGSHTFYGGSTSNVESNTLAYFMTYTRASTEANSSPFASYNNTATNAGAYDRGLMGGCGTSIGGMGGSANSSGAGGNGDSGWGYGSGGGGGGSGTTVGGNGGSGMDGQLYVIWTE